MTVQNREVVRDYFDAFADRYEAERYEAADNVHAYNLIRRRVAILDITARLPGRVLDAGTGPGALIEGLLAQEHDVVAIDVALAMARRAAEKRHGGRRPAVGVGTIDDLAFPAGRFDVVVAAGVIEYVADERRAVTEVRRVLRPGGSAILSFPLRRRTSDFVRAAAAPVVDRVRGARPEPAWSRSYAPPRVDRLLAAAGLRVVERRFLHFVFFPLDALAPRVAIRLEPLVAASARRLGLGRLAKTYLVRAEAI
jgi:2-polyprenyl-3-methyl-5-hydroxy-6-metoxy-1,4-benzoquinol methylase